MSSQGTKTSWETIWVRAAFGAMSILVAEQRNLTGQAFDV